MVVIIACNIMKRLGGGGSCVLRRLRPEETAEEILYLSQQEQSVCWHLDSSDRDENEIL